MFSITAEFLTSLLLSVGVSASVIHDTFTIVESLADKVCPAERRLLEVKATNTLSCLAKAGRRSECTGVSYDGNTNMCYICDTFLDLLPESFQSLTGTTFYHRSKVLPDGYTTVVAGHLLKIVPGTAANYSQAESACSEWAWGALVRIDTTAKQDAIRSFLLDPANGLTSDRFWIQAQRDSSDGVWKFDDGSEVPMTQQYWHPGQPDFELDECAYMLYHFDFYWDNFACDNRIGYICEMV